MGLLRSYYTVPGTKEDEYGHDAVCQSRFRWLHCSPCFCQIADCDFSFLPGLLGLFQLRHTLLILLLPVQVSRTCKITTAFVNCMLLPLPLNAGK